MKATIKRAPDGSILAYEISTEGVPGAERANIEYTPNSRTINYGEGCFIFREWDAGLGGSC